MITWLSPDDPPERFPPHEAALRDPPGLLAAGGDLKFERLIAAYERGIFTWYSPGQPVLWWSPDPREVLLPGEFHRSRRFARSLRTRGFEWQQDRDFAAVVAACINADWLTVMKSGARIASWAASTACGWVACSSASRCSAANAMHPRPPWRDWSPAVAHWASS